MISNQQTFPRMSTRVCLYHAVSGNTTATIFPKAPLTAISGFVAKVTPTMLACSSVSLDTKRLECTRECTPHLFQKAKYWPSCFQLKYFSEIIRPLFVGFPGLYSLVSLVPDLFNGCV